MQELESELYGVTIEREAVRSELDYARARLRNAGSGHRVHSVRSRAGDDSEDAYRELRSDRTAILAHDRHLTALVRRLGAELRAARTGRLVAA